MSNWDIAGVLIILFAAFVLCAGHIYAKHISKDGD